MSTYPTPEVWRAHAARARKMAQEYLDEGNTRKADQREDDADFYESRAVIEEWRLAQITRHPEAA